MKVQLLPLTRLFMIQCFLTMLVAMPFADANAQGRPGQGPGRPGQGPVGPGMPAPRIIETQVNKYIYERDQINVSQELRLAQGQKILGLIITAQGTSHRSMLGLFAGARLIEEKLLSAHSSQLVYHLPMQTNLNSLVLKVKGGAFISKIGAELDLPVGPMPGQEQIVRAQVNQQYHGQSILPVRQLIAQTGVQLMGQKVESVILRASSARGQARAQLLINGQAVGVAQIIPMQETRLVFNLPRFAQNIIGQDLRTIQIEVNGNVFVNLVGLRLDQQGYNQTAQVQVNQRFMSNQRLSLAQVLGHQARIDMQRPIEAITVVAQGHGNIMLAGSGTAQGGIQVQGATTQSVAIHGFASAQDIMMRFSGNIVIESIRIKFAY
jgi:hypothetical protein